ncbi:hemerythrin domain-containing protein [Roseomonas sp. PWR1]|uniref:Hemerythrin domain-containing protein n=1 Tax=Roseomonas nitratireducens TaxID=2820810 RepID=A0ABS4ASR1_9PROT|nr:hemerythrin domain-containing protein [Neoroseomonas nitratireducens]MBP0464279.1 hemerythrin domain-containing protein [Neoroseomonas nitratireducens]
MGGPGALFGSLDPALLADPLGFLSAEHARQRALLGHLERFARKPGRRGRVAMARALAAWLAHDLPLHLRDEEESLFPRLPAVIAPLVDTLAADGRVAARQCAMLQADLLAIARGHPAPARFLPAALDFAAAYRRHLALEEAELLPAARRILNTTERDAIAGEMAARRDQGGTDA